MGVYFEVCLLSSKKKKELFHLITKSLIVIKPHWHFLYLYTVFYPFSMSNYSFSLSSKTTKNIPTLGCWKEVCSAR